MFPARLLLPELNNTINPILPPSSIPLNLATPADAPPKPGLRSLLLGQQQLVYRLQRSQRRTIGFLIDRDGLRITAPKWVAIAQIDAAICEKQQWILAKLQEQQQRATRDLQLQVRWCDGARFPYLGDLLTLRIAIATKVVTIHNHNDCCLTLCLPEQTSELQVQRRVQMWLQRQARALFTARLHDYAEKLGVGFSGLALSSARTRWGSCSADGKIRLNWRLVHFPLPLIDYVIAHEVAHLREMNHGPRFWATVQSIYPDHAAARKALRAHAPGSLPIFE